MRHVITGVLKDSVAQRHGLQVGDVLLFINGEEIQDEIDYQSLGAQSHVVLTVERSGAIRAISLKKEDWEPVGLRFGDSMMLKPRICRNNCIFCFIDQMPPSLRSSLYIKDDDWRFSLMMGNYITLTNTDENEFARILRRHASPLYVSVHTTNPALRRRMMNNRQAGDILTRLCRLKDAGIQFHCQIVCCPEINDGNALMQTLEDLYSLTPAAQSVAIVPVGITKFRDGLPRLTPFNARSAKSLLDQIKPFQKRCKETLGTSFVFASDEFYCLSGEDLPPITWYEGYPQIENGVGMLRQFEEQMQEALEDDDDILPAQPKTYVIATSVSAATHIKRLCDTYAPDNATVHIETIINHFFGETVTVAGLLTGVDVLEQLSPALLKQANTLLISASMLRHDRDMFLCGMMLDEFKRRLPIPVRVTDDGYDFYNALHDQ